MGSQPDTNQEKYVIKYSEKYKTIHTSNSSKKGKDKQPMHQVNVVVKWGTNLRHERAHLAIHPAVLYQTNHMP